MVGKTPFSPTLLQVRQPRHRPSIHSLIKVILKKHASYQPLHRANAAPPGRQPENGRSALPAVGVQRLQQDPERPGCSCLHGTEVTCEEKRLARYGAAEIKPICTVYTHHPRFDTKPVWDLSFLSQELVTFAKYVLNRFFALTAQNNKAYIELLFWKNVGAVREMTEGYSDDRSVVLWFHVVAGKSSFIGSSLPLTHQRGNEAKVEWRGGRGVA